MGDRGLAIFFLEGMEGQRWKPILGIRVSLLVYVTVYACVVDFAKLC